jgi:8-oxo-dGTP diphosphatase
MIRKTDKHIHVSCAIIERNGLVLAAQRSESMSMPLKWEFPGGKIKTGESPEESLRREIVEELDISINAHTPLSPSTHDYPSIRVTLYPFVCSILTGEIKRLEHKAVTWLPPDELCSLDWAEADRPVLDSYCRILEKLNV